MKDKNQVFVVSLAITIIMAIWAVAFNANFTVVSNAAYSFLTNNFGWLYLMAMTAFVIFSVAIAFSKWGKIKLGPDDSKPEYSTVSWFAMLFGAGMGVGLVFWGISEPLAHFSNPIPGIEAGTEAAANFAIRSSYMHWGLHPWANYCIIGLGLAYFQFRKGKPGLISSIFEPLIGEKGINGWVGKTIDVLAVFATVAGVVTSLGLGVMQINAGLNYLFGIPTPLIVVIVCVLITTLLLKYTALGLYIQSVGINKRASRIAGLNSKRIIFLCYLVCGLCAAIAGLVASSRITSADSNNIGLNMELDAILAVALGGNALSGGKFNLAGSIIGAYTIQAITTTMYNLGVSTEVTPVFKAVVVIIIVAIQAPPVKAWFNKRSAAKAAAKKEVAKV